MNSVRRLSQDLSGEMTSYVKGLLNSPMNRDKIVIAIEGADDRDFYERYLSRNKVVFGIMNGHKWTTTVLQNLNPYFKERLAAINDADFSHLDGIEPEYENLFVSDCHDWEMTVISAQRTNDIALSYNVTANNAAKLHDDIISKIRNYSYVRWANEQNEDTDKKIAFKANTHEFSNLSIKDCVDKLNSCQKETQRHIDPDFVLEFESNRRDAEWEQLHNGHDYFRMLHTEIQHLKGIKDQPKKGDIISGYIELYPKGEFVATKLARSLSNWFAPRDIFN